MVNTFQLSYKERLAQWVRLRTELQNLPLDEAVIMTDNWWQQAPIVAHHIHPLDTRNWPDPWELLSDNIYCVLTRALGMIYTLRLVGIDATLAEATDDHGSECYIVIVDKYVLNHWPNCVSEFSLTQFTIKRKFNLSEVLSKLNG